MADDFYGPPFFGYIQCAAHACNASAGKVYGIEIRIAVAVFQCDAECVLFAVLVFLYVQDESVGIGLGQLILETGQPVMVAGEIGGADNDSCCLLYTSRCV